MLRVEMQTRLQDTVVWLSTIGKEIPLDRSTFLRLIHELFDGTWVIEVTLQCENPHKFMTQIYIVDENVSKKMNDCVVIAFTIVATVKYLDEIWSDIVMSTHLDS